MLEVCSYFVKLDAGFPSETGNQFVISHSVTFPVPHGAVIDDVEESEDCRGLTVTCRVPQGQHRELQAEKKLILCQVRQGESEFGEVTEVKASDHFLKLLRLTQRSFTGSNYAVYEQELVRSSAYRAPSPG